MAGASLWLRSGFTIHAIGDAGFDDALFVRLARSLGAGVWLGSFDNTTLVKGMFYPLFILLSFAAGIPLKLAEQGVYLAASAYVALMVARSERSRWAGTALLVALAFNPVLWSVDLSRIIREGLYVGLCLALVGVLASVALSRRPLTAGGLARGLLLGILGGCYWMTREEGVWLVPTAALVALLGLAALPARIARCVPFGMAALGFAAVIGSVMAMNERVYGIAETVEVKSKAFERAYGALSRISHEHWRRYVVVPRDARALAYSVSPAARELRPSLDGDNGAAWTAIGCEASRMPDCTEIQASWFQWALRDAVAAAGHYRSLPEAARFYTQLAHEIDDACDRGAIPCLPRRASLMPPFRARYLLDSLWAAPKIAAILLHPDPSEITRRPSGGLGGSVDLFAEIAGPVTRRPHAWFVMDGWMGARSGTPLLTLRAPAGATVRSEITARPDPAAPAGQGFPVLRVRLVTDCPTEQCDLVLEADDRILSLGKLDSIAAAAIDQSDLLFKVTQTGSQIAYQSQERRDALIEQIARRIAAVYAILLPVMTVLGAIGLVLTVKARGKQAFASPLVLLTVASAVAVVSRIALLAYVDVTSIASENTLYTSPASPFVILFACAGTIMLARTVALRASSRRR